MGMGEGQKNENFETFCYLLRSGVTTHLPDFTRLYYMATIVHALSLIGCFLVITGKY